MNSPQIPDLVTQDPTLDRAWRLHGPIALRFATALVGPHDAHDIVTTVFLRATAQPEWQSIEWFDRYLVQGIRHEANNLYRQRRRQWERDLNGLRPDASVDALPDVDLWRAVAALGVEQRSVVFLAYWHDLTEAEIADTLDVARSTVHRNLVRARAKLRKALR